MSERIDPTMGCSGENHCQPAGDNNLPYAMHTLVVGGLFCFTVLAPYGSQLSQFHFNIPQF
jgi:hypothetical protein